MRNSRLGSWLGVTAGIQGRSTWVQGSGSQLSGSIPWSETRLEVSSAPSYDRDWWSSCRYLLVKNEKEGKREETILFRDSCSWFSDVCLCTNQRKSQKEGSISTSDSFWRGSVSCVTMFGCHISSMLHVAAWLPSSQRWWGQLWKFSTRLSLPRGARGKVGTSLQCVLAALCRHLLSPPTVSNSQPYLQLGSCRGLRGGECCLCYYNLMLSRLLLNFIIQSWRLRNLFDLSWPWASD